MLLRAANGFLREDGVMKLRWEKQSIGQRERWWAYSGKLVIGMVFKRDDGTVGYTMQAVQMKLIGKGDGDVSSISAGKRAIERGWHQWLTAADLIPPKGVDRADWEMGLL